MDKQIHVIFSGNVQGIGFRLTAEKIAHDLNIVGWVKNLRNGNVEIVAEASEEVLSDFLDRIRASFDTYIGNVKVDWFKPSGEFREFRIKF